MNEKYQSVPAKTVDRMIEVLNETYFFYMSDPSRRGMDKKGSCLYRTEDGKKCAVGRCMRRPTIEMSGAADSMYRDRAEHYEIELEDRLKPQYMGLPIRFWSMLQHWHDDQYDWRVLAEKGDGHLLHQGYLEIYKMAVGGEFKEYC